MTPIDFPESNRVLGDNGYRSDAVKEIIGLPVHSDGEQCISCWRLSWSERLSVLLTGRVWVSVLFGGTQPPIAVMAENPFEKRNPSGPEGG